MFQVLLFYANYYIPSTIFQPLKKHPHNLEFFDVLGDIFDKLLGHAMMNDYDGMSK